MRFLLCLPCLVAMTVTATEVSDDFSTGLGQWEPLLANHWELREDGENARLVLKRPGKQRPPLRRPTQFALLKGAPWWDVTVDVSIKTLRPDKVKGRDVCVLFGRRDDTHFYYAHVCSDSNGKTHNVIMKVDGKKRRVIMREKRPKARLTAAWHKVRVTHQSDGEIKVYMDDMETPLMTAVDRDYPLGQVGLGSFDDPAMFDDVKVSGRRLDDDPGVERVVLHEAKDVPKEWRQTVAVPEGDGHVVCEFEARRDPAKGDVAQPGGWWRFQEFQDAEKTYLTGGYGAGKLTDEYQTFTSRAYLPAKVGFVRVGVGQKGKDLHQVRAVRLWHERPKIELVEPLAGAKLADGTPRLAWSSGSDRLTVEVSASVDFAEAQSEVVEDTHVLAWQKPLAPGTWHWRVRNVDGAVSETRAFTQSAPLATDRLDPQITVQSTFLPKADDALAVTLAGGDAAAGMYVEATINGLAAKVAATPTGWSVRPAKAWQQGLNRVLVRAVDAAANSVEKRAYVTHVSAVPPRVTWTVNQGVSIEGQAKPFFPLAMYMVRDFEMPLVRKAGFNLVQHYGADGPLDPEKTREWLQAARENDLRAFVAFHRGRLHAGDLDFVAERVGALLGEPALLAWYMFDEPELTKHGLRPHVLARVKRLIAALDPFHPVLITCYHEHYLDEYADCYDVYLTQAYHNSPTGVLKEATFSRELLAKTGRPGSIIMNNKLPFIAYDALRVQAYLCAMEQNGVFVWGWWDDYQMRKFAKNKKAFHERFAALPDAKAQRAAFEAEWETLTTELGALAPAFTAAGEPTLTEMDGVVVWSKKTPAGAWMIVANPTDEEKRIDLPKLKPGTRLGPYGVMVGKPGQE